MEQVIFITFAFYLGTSECSEPGKLGLVKSQEEFNSSVLTGYTAADDGLQAAPRQTEILPVGLVAFSKNNFQPNVNFASQVTGMERINLPYSLFSKRETI